jgi:hypothetical protein
VELQVLQVLLWLLEEQQIKLLNSLRQQLSETP